MVCKSITSSYELLFLKKYSTFGDSQLRHIIGEAVQTPK